MQKMWDDGERVLCRIQRHTQSGSIFSVLTARSTSDQPSPAGLRRLAHEMALKSELDSAWAATPVELLHERGQQVLVLEDHGGRLLAELLDAPLEPAASLQLAIGIAAALEEFHASGLVHKDIKPAHILVNCADGRARLTGFGLASRLPRERQLPEPPETIAGTLAYMAPEQTGRMNRSIDSRSDLYSLGVTFYQMLTGVLPFTATDAMEWVHCHIAKKPLPLCERLAGIPKMVSDIVMKLLAKTAEDRYQTAAGVMLDLQRCLAGLQQGRPVEMFALDEQSASEQLLICEKLYGREHEVQTLIDAFNRVVHSGHAEWVLVSGYAGIGKSSVVNELHKILVPPRGLFASGKFDQYQRDVPFATLAQAFQGLVRGLLGKTEAQLAGWRQALLEALDADARLITDLIPELKLIIGEPLPVPDLEPQQAQHRFLRVFRLFIGVFAKAEHPLALFLDDLQWLDSGTLDLLEDLLTHAEMKHLLLIGAYRDNEVGTSHPLTAKLQAIRDAGVTVSDVRLNRLTEPHIAQIIREAIRYPTARVEPLAHLVMEKTDGNPFFVIQFLRALAQQHLLAFDHAERGWRWDLQLIRAQGFTDNVVDLMVGKLSRLTLQTQVALQQLACLGNVAQISTIASVLGLSEPQLHAVIWEAMSQDLVERREGAYAFVHDRIQEAAYSLIPEAARPQSHLQIGRLLVAHTPPEKREEAIFEITGQLNHGAQLMTDAAERIQLAAFNLMAGQRAKSSTAYVSALAYFTAGAGCIGDNGWKHQHELTFALELNRAQCEFLTGQLSIADRRLDALSSRATTTVERAKVACLQMDVCLLMDRSEGAVQVCLAYLRHVGIQWSAQPDDTAVHHEYDQIWRLLGDRSIEDLVHLPLMEDAASLMTLEALSKLFAPALQSDANLACLTICKAVSLSLEWGNCDASCMLYANVGRVSGRRFGDYQTGLRFGQLGCALIESRGLNRFEASTYLCFSNFVVRWMRPTSECRQLLRHAFATANRIGDLAYGAFTGNALNSDLLFAGEPLFELQMEAERGHAYACKVGFGLVIDSIATQLAFTRSIRGLTATFGCFDDDHFNERTTEAHLTASSGLAQTACWYWIRKLQALYMADDFAGAVHAASKAQQLLWTSFSFYEEAEYYFYDALTRAALCPSVSPNEREVHLGCMVANYRQLQIWEEQCPENFASRVALTGAEIARVEHRMVDAQKLYEQAIASAQDSGALHIEALANELASRFYQAGGFAKIARLYLQDARYCYLRWGANGKVRQLDARHVFLRPEETSPGPAATMAASVEHLDLATVLKVSQAASGNIILEKLIDMIMLTAIEQGGAVRGLLILSDGDVHQIAAQATTGERTTQLDNVAPTPEQLPLSVFHHVRRTRENVVLDDAQADPLFASDPYIRQHRSRSILCLPLMNQAHFTGALYLENNLTASAFRPSRIAVLRLVASQAAISLENARLYREVAEREGKIRRLVDANIMGVIVWNARGDIIEANDAFLRLVGYERKDLISGRVRWRDLTPAYLREESECHLAEVLRDGQVQPFEKEYVRKDGTRVPVIVGLATFEPDRREGVAFVLDLSERRLSEEKVRESEERYREAQNELAHANRVATMGHLAASIVHEVSQPITATLSSAQAALRWLNAQPPEAEEVQQSLEQIVQNGKRASEVLGRIRKLIRKAPPQSVAVDVNTAIRETIELTRGQVVKCNVCISMQLAAGLPYVTGDPVELQQVLLNLILNALEAMRDVPEGERQLIISSVLEDSRHVLISVCDSGPGFGADSFEQVFAPFYTTKSTGLGMGLSICHSIIEAHGGLLWASDTQPSGARVQFTLPIYAEPESMDAPGQR